MRLEIRKAKVRDLAFGERTGLRKGLLTVNEEELLEPLRRIGASSGFGSTWPGRGRASGSCRSRTPWSPG
jgi:hypothetical protein